jgi:hypothetical protein
MESGGQSILEVSREELYELVWTKPLSRLAAESGLKTSELVRVCEQKQVPRPTSGYWVLIRMGRTPERAPLPDFNEQEAIDLPAAEEKRTEETPTSVADSQHESSPAPFDLSLSRPHPLIKVTRKYLQGLKVPRGETIPPDLKTCFHLNVTKGTLDRVLRIADGILKNWEAVGGTVEIVPSRQNASFETQLKLDGDCAPVVLFELIRRVEIPQTSMDIWSYRQYRYEATGQLVWKVEAFADGLRTKWSDGKVQRLEDVLPSIISGMKKILATRRQHRIDRECVEKQRAEIRTLRLAEQSRQKELEARKQSLLENVRSFRQAEDIREYVKTLRRKVESNEIRVTDRESFEDWIHFATCFAAEVDPLSDGPAYSVASRQPTNRLVADIDLTLACRTVVDQLSVKDTDELYAVNMETVHPLCKGWSKPEWDEICRVLEMLGYDVAGRSRDMFL